MNQRHNNGGVGRLTGRSEVDAGMLRYRELLGREQHTVPRRSRLGGIFRASSARQRRVTSAVTAGVLLALAVSFATFGQVAELGAVSLTPGSAGGGWAVSGIQAAPGAFIVAESVGSFELTVAGYSAEAGIACYNGELCRGPYAFAP